jgi:hypothetical protein
MTTGLKQPWVGIAAALTVRHSTPLHSGGFASSFGNLDTINPNCKGFQIINHLRNYYKQITLFCFASQGGEAEAGASPGGVAKRGCASPRWVAKQESVRRH